MTITELIDRLISLKTFADVDSKVYIGNIKELDEVIILEDEYENPYSRIELR